MDSNYNVPFILLLLSLAFIAFTIYYHQTVLLGFSIFAFFNILRSTSSAFLIGHIFGINQAFVRYADLWVIFYSAVGLICFTLGIWLAWQPLRQNKALIVKIHSANWLNPRFAITLMVLGIIVYAASPIVSRIPTLQAVWSNFRVLPNIGLLIVLAHGITNQNYRYIRIGLCIFILLVIPETMRSGHVGAGGMFMIQAILVATCWRRVNLRSFLLLCVGILAMGSLYIGWLNSRYLIREGYLESYSLPERILRFSESFQVVNPLKMEPLILYGTIKERLDMSDILAAQVIYQPIIEPYAYGATVTSDLLAALVPRFLWPSKPFQAGGSVFVSRYTGLIWNDTSMGLPYPFELYANGGAVAVFIGLFIIGWLLAKLELYLITADLELPKFLGLSVILFPLTGGENRIILICMIAISGFIGSYLLGKFLNQINKNGWLLPKQDNYQTTRWTEQDVTMGSFKSRSFKVRPKNL